VIWLAVHTAEGATTADSLANFLANPTNQVSYNTVCDDTTTIQIVPYEQEAWAMLGGNPRADQICCTGFAAWSRDTWMAHRGMLDRIAQWLAHRAHARGIPLTHIGPQGVANRSKGVIGHYDYTIGAQDGTHTDPGPNFPWDYVIATAVASATPQTKSKDRHTMDQLPATATPTDPNSAPATWPQRNFDIGFDLAGGWEGECAIGFGGQDWGGRTKDTTRAFVYLASWMLRDGSLVPVDATHTAHGGGQTVEAHTIAGPWQAPHGAVGLTVNYAAPGGAYAVTGRSA